MAYTKLTKVLRDFALGYQSVNAAQDNEQALRDGYDAEHIDLTADSASGSGSGIITPISMNGMHDAVNIPRAIAVIDVALVKAGIGNTKTEFWFDLLTAGGKHVVPAGLSRLALGVYLLKLKSTDDLSVWIEAHPEGGASGVRFINTRYSSQLAGAPITGVLLNLFELNSTTGKFAAADYPFSLAVFSR